MNTPDPMKKLFAEYTVTVTAEAPIDDADRLWRKAKHRRIGQVAAAGAAVIALTGSATWAFQQHVPAEEQETANQTTPLETVPDEPGEEKEIFLDMLGAGPDLVGAELDLPSFVPGNADVDAVCGPDGVVLGDGTFEEPVENGAVFLVQATYATLYEDRDKNGYEIGLFGCRYGEETLYQAVTLEEVEDDTWEAREQLVHSEPGGESPQYMVWTEEHDLVIGFAERYDGEADDLRYWAEHVGLDADGALVREPLAELGGAGYSDLSVDIDAVETEEPGIWTVTVGVRNIGPRDISDHFLDVGIDEEITVLSGEPLGNVEEGIWNRMPGFGDLEVGQTYTQEWTVAVAPDLDGDGISPRFDVGIEAVAPWEERPDAVETLIWGQEGAVHYFYE
jgi:hypothetical protein